MQSQLIVGQGDRRTRAVINFHIFVVPGTFDVFADNQIRCGRRRKEIHIQLVPCGSSDSGPVGVEA